MKTSDKLYDVIIVGGGPAGLSAAIYMARAKYKVLVMEKEKFGGQITITSEIVNYPGVEKTSGKALTRSMKKQAEDFGAEFILAEVLDFDLEQEIKLLHTTAGEYKALGIILATGANPRKLGFKGEKEFQGRGVAYCATCDGEFFTGMDVFVIGGGFAAVEEGIFLTRYAKKVTMIVREEDFTCARTVADQVKDQPKIQVKFSTEIVEAGGEQYLTYARFKNNKTGEEWTYEAPEKETFGIFVFAGYVPSTEWLEGKVELDARGYLVTDRNQKTSVDGIYGAGDVCIKDLRQVVTAVSDGASAATSLEKYVSGLHEKLNIPQLIQPEKKEILADGERENGDHGFFSEEIRRQLENVFPKFTGKAVVRAILDDSPLAGEMEGFLGELEDLTDRIIVKKERVGKEEKERRQAEGQLLPAFVLELEDGGGKNISFHGVPGGHEFNSFILALYQVAGPGQPTDENIQKTIQAIHKELEVKVMVSLSCTMCPQVVMGVQRAASLNPKITGRMVDLMHYPELKKKYAIMSVPCMVVNDDQVYFGKKSLEEIAEILAKA